MPSAPSPAKQRPFDVIVITSPDDQSARAVRELIVSSCGDFPPPAALSVHDDASALQSSDGTLFLSSSDPFGTRMGSGGGTIAALAAADGVYLRRRSMRGDAASNNGAPTHPTVLICHAGGESSRCPTQIVLGKAWTSLPVEKRTSNGQISATISNPTALLISSLSDVFGDLPAGSVVVAASDVLLSFDATSSSCRKIKFDTKKGNSHSRVIGLAVPAPLTTAKNHGVFVLNSPQHQENEWKTHPTHRVLQKPSVSEMTRMENPNCTFEVEDESEKKPGHDHSSERRAWIDTGVITFLPDAACTLRELSRSTLKCCTRDGLSELYQEQFDVNIVVEQEEAQQQNDDPTPRPELSLEEFSRLKAPKICLYGDMLHALRTSSTATTKRAGPPESSNLSALLSEKLSEHELYTCTIPTGSFVHLGTTKELKEFLTLGTSDCVDGTDVRETVQRGYRHFGKAIGLTRRANSFVSGFSPDDGCGGHVVINSTLCSNAGSLGRRSVVEHCHIECDNVQIGNGCMVSGIRGKVKGRSIRVPDQTCLQLLPLRQSWNQSNPSINDTLGGSPSFACICIGVDDIIKEVPAKALFGLDLQFIFKRSGLAETDLWDESVPSSQRCLWNAKINPLVSAEGDGMEINFSFLAWIDALQEENCLDNVWHPTSPAMLGLKKWKEATRLSLVQIRSCVDSKAEARYRGAIKSKGIEEKSLSEVSEILMSRRHEACNFDYVYDFISNSMYGTTHFSWDTLRRALGALDAVVMRASIDGNFDIMGRTFMTMSTLLSDTARMGIPPWDKCKPSFEGIISNVDKGALLDESIKEAIVGLHAPQIPEEAINSIKSVRDSLLGSHHGYYDVNMAVECCDFLERAASAMTERCVSGNALRALAQTLPIPIGAAATASAPARIDLSGGWSDTPPISYEYGGAVACLAVLVDGKRPLRAQCRMVKGRPGIRLRTESRKLSDETLVAFSDVTMRTVGDLANFCNPTADCALLKCALIHLGLVPLDSIDDNESSAIQPYLKTFCQTDLDDVGLEITSQSLLPTGSGMGGSSILGGCIISAIAKCVGIKLTGMREEPTKDAERNDSNSLIHAVLMLEQLLTTGGGWQDNIGGLVGGLKLGSSDALILPLQPKVQRFDVPQALAEELNKRLVLAFSGKPRLAKNILQSVLRRWARRSTEIIGTVEGLVKGASEAIECFRAGDLDALGQVMSQYWQSKIAMAGVESGVEPRAVHSLFDLLSSKGDIVGGTVCGAGGGGFLALLASKGKTTQDIKATVENAVLNGSELGLDNYFSWHSCMISEDGLLVEITQD